MKGLIPLPVIALTATLFSNTVVAQTGEDYHPFLTDKFNVGVDGTLPEKEFDFDETLGFDDYETSPSLVMATP